MHEGSEFINGQPKDTSMDTYRLLRMGELSGTAQDPGESRPQ